jgi:hypothetical protein
LLSNISSKVVYLADELHDLDKEVEILRASVYFTLTEQSYKKLEKDALPGNFISKLRNFKDMSYKGKNAFVEAIKKALLEPEQAVYIPDIVKSAEVSYEKQDKLTEIKIEKNAKWMLLQANLSIIEILIGCIPFLKDDIERASADEENNYKNQFLNTLSLLITQTMSNYFLPMLYGVVGTCAYILRSLSKEIKKIIFSEASVVQYWLRLPLGILSGLAIGWFFKTDTLTRFVTIQPFALAFVAGYSVDLLFIAMDRLIGAFMANDNKSEAIDKNKLSDNSRGNQ